VSEVVSVWLRKIAQVLGTSGLQNAGAIAAIVGASVAVLLLVAGIVRWWWRRHRVSSVKARIFGSGPNLYLGVTGLPASTAEVIALISDDNITKKIGPNAYRPDRGDEALNLQAIAPPLSESVQTYGVEVISVYDRGEHRRVFKKSLKTPWALPEV
jgi:hypothetical protein